jgi:ankyrin repeat protein
MLNDASYNGQLEVVKLLIEAGANVNSESKIRYTALMWAYKEGYLDIVNLLKKHGAKYE